ncbi:hypothetical protein [Paenibacillus sp. 276b]|uniref:hypothetical protein n=1 Tax=Paenibacillus sp. 276b TaxID=1566277 RepID=UPI00089B1B70|nr:hypothetical protein [Paenibacillus sp. 276b]SEB27530.1 hypothetical protein SAMN03159332_6194 [Paenibacillus sp. 276b]
MIKQRSVRWITMIVLAILCGSLLSSVVSAKSTSVKIILSDEQLTEAFHEALQSHTLEINIDLYDSIEQISKKTAKCC